MSRAFLLLALCLAGCAGIEPVAATEPRFRAYGMGWPWAEYQARHPGSVP